MKSFIYAIAAASIFAAPAISFAQQSNAPMTRAQVQGQLVQLENAGYHPNNADVYYPAQLQAAQARVDTQAGAGSYGPSLSGSSQSSGSGATGQQSIYFGN